MAEHAEGGGAHTPHAQAKQPSSGSGLRGDIRGQVVLVLQGGGALGAYQAGVFHALHDAGIEPDWVIGTSIGAINGAIIAGNPPEKRLVRLREFWNRVTWNDGCMTAMNALAPLMCGLPASFIEWLRDASIVTHGIPSFFTPRADAWFGLYGAVGPERAAFYHTEPLRETLASLVDFDCLNARQMRLTVGTVGVSSGHMHYFTNRDAPLAVDHVMASAAFPPGFPSVRIGGEAFWDGGIYSNTPLEAVLDDRPRRDSVIFTVQLWPVHGPEPLSIREAMTRQRDIQYSSRAESHLERQKQIHNLRHVIRELGKHMTTEQRDSDAVKQLLDWGCGTTMQVIELDAPRSCGHDLHKDIDFSAIGIERRWTAGYDDTRRMIARAPWCVELDPMEGIAVHRSDPAAV
ncbi:patatin-like phospholipase family protein [Paraburkholderia rhizosphaerae]|uniref:NTE family protein n=1 Tax=Paraburkholderia rhizosphaerae TaxID=480658 RepID=A0A4R8LV20_9BURK|nr:patatin-like phospholipase family protein [Paraburkholderia rhizosphaerae]TDY51650.1 NTE family protein [Paraburkholderia rhizosphaerae]